MVRHPLLATTLPPHFHALQPNPCPPAALNESIQYRGLTGNVRLNYCQLVLPIVHSSRVLDVVALRTLTGAAELCCVPEPATLTSSLALRVGCDWVSLVADKVSLKAWDFDHYKARRAQVEAQARKRRQPLPPAAARPKRGKGASA